MHDTAKACLIAVLLAASATAGGAPGDRSEKWQISLMPTFYDSTAISFQGGAAAELNERSEFAIGVGYNFNQHLELEMDMGGGGAGYTGTRIGDDGSTEKLTANYYMSHLNLGLTANFLKGRLTPFVRGSLGWTFIDSGIPTGDISTVCWYDPWIGYVCTPYVHTYTKTEWHYGGDVGLRFDVTDKMYLKGSVGQTYVDFDKAGTEAFTHYRFTVGFMFW